MHLAAKLAVPALIALSLPTSPALATDPCEADSGAANCRPIEQVTIFGTAPRASDVAGGASLLTAQDLEDLVITDVVRAMRQVPGVSLQLEDGYGLRPNISIRGTATERSSRVTLLEDNVLIAPAPYAAPAAYYFPTFGRIRAVEVLKGPAAITQGPYTVGGAVNLMSTPIPATRAGHFQSEGGSNATWRLHAWYGDTGERAAFLVETHQWASDGFQSIDRSRSDTGLDKSDYLARLRFSSAPGDDIGQEFEIKLQASDEQSRQSYLGLTDGDFSGAPLRRYGLSAQDEMDHEHSQLSASWRLDLPSGLNLDITAYNNDFERAWYKTEGIDLDGSESPENFRRTSWASVVSAVNRSEAAGGASATELQAILDGGDTLPGSIQLRNNARDYYSRGIQLTAGWDLDAGASRHALQAGLRYHEDQEDRLQRNDNWHQQDGFLVLDAMGLEGNAGNRVQDAQAWAAFVHDRIEWQRWTLTPGLRYESIELSRLDYGTSGTQPHSRTPDNLRDVRSNHVDVLIPGLGALYAINDRARLVAGIHKGFATPGNAPGVDPEESINYELGLRYEAAGWQLEAMGFFNDYENLIGVCTNSSGSHCEPGDAFNGEGVHIPGLEVSAQASLNGPAGWFFPVRLAWTWMDAKFQSDFNSEFFGDVRRGDPVPYIPEHQLWASVGAEHGPFTAMLSVTHSDSVCTRASCDELERTESGTVLDLALHYRIGEQWTLYGAVENLADEVFIAGREPYGARPNKPRSWVLGARFDY